MKFLLFPTLLILLISCGPTNSQTPWPDIEKRLVEINEKYEYSQITIQEIPASEKEKLMSLSPEELERTLAEIDKQQAADHARVKAISDKQKAKVEAFEQIVLPLIDAAKSREEFHRIVLEHQQYCNEEMIAEAKAWLAANTPQPQN